MTDDPTESEKASDDTRHKDGPALYSSVPFGSESGTEAGDESGPGHDNVEPGKPSSSRGPDDNLPELTGRSRAILKTYFADAKPFTLPLGHPTVAFLEAQMYHLLRVLSVETLRLSYSTMEKMVIDAVKGKPTVAPSKTSHFFIKIRAQTPGRWHQSDQSSSEAEYHSNADSRALTPTSAGDTGGSSFEGESDSATEMALISATLGGDSQLAQSSQETDRVAISCTTAIDETTGPSSQDTTLLELQEQARGTKAKSPAGRKLPNRSRRLASRGVPMRKNSSPRSGGPDPLFLGPLTPFITRIWSGAICARKTFRFGQRVPLKSCATTVQRGTCGVTSDGGTNTSRLWTPSAGRYGSRPKWEGVDRNRTGQGNAAVHSY